MAEFNEDSPTHVSFNRHKNGTKKERYDDRYHYPKEVYTVVERMIHGGLGKVWNKTYSKIVEKFPKEIPANHVMDEIVNREIEKHVQVVKKANGKKQYIQGCGDYIFKKYFVHPVSGVLTLTPEKHYRSYYGWNNQEKEEALKNKHVKIKDKHYHQINDVWYKLQMAPAVTFNEETFSEIKVDSVNDPFIALLNLALDRELREKEYEATENILPPNYSFGIHYEQTLGVCRKIYKEEIFCTSFRQMGKKEIHHIFGKQEEKQVPNIVRKK